MRRRVRSLSVSFTPGGEAQDLAVVIVNSRLSDDQEALVTVRERCRVSGDAMAVPGKLPPHFGDCQETFAG